MGEVWRARDERLAREVAIKLLLPHPAGGERARAFEHEARAAGTLNHPNVLTVYDVGDYGGAAFLVTECLDGESLRARLSAGALPVDAALDVARQVAARPRRRARPRHRASRPEAGEHLPRARRPCKDPRFRSRDTPRPRRRQCVCARRRHGGLHAPGAGARRGRRSTCRHLRARRRALRNALRMPALQGEQRTRNSGRVLDAPSPASSRRRFQEFRRGWRTSSADASPSPPDDRFATVADVESALDSVIRERNPRALTQRSCARPPAGCDGGHGGGHPCDGCRGLAMASVGVPRPMGAHRCGAGDSAALESW